MVKMAHKRRLLPALKHQTDNFERAYDLREYEITLQFKDIEGQRSLVSKTFPDDENCFEKFRLCLQQAPNGRHHLQILHWNTKCSSPNDTHAFDLCINGRSRKKRVLRHFSTTALLCCHQWKYLTTIPSMLTDILNLNIKIRIPVSKPQCSFKCLQDETQLKDFTLIDSKGRESKIHRVVLATQSPVFLRILKCSPRKTSLRLSYDFVTLCEFIDYIYTGKKPQTNLTQVLKLARHFQMPDLESKCIDALFETVTVYNSIQLFSFAIANDCQSLLYSVLSFIRNNFNDIVVENGKTLPIGTDIYDILDKPMKELVGQIQNEPGIPRPIKMEVNTWL